ncbi:Uncharacterized membrane protein YgdD, TMEM256/DUF423 family [Zobellia uliginosa]|uniref:Uncharacterized membrane protein YgdD, TMEM256/DUF423 family n=1 Tax=Zobellia uliginosa TaxID=143224 RepID=A0ABY1KJA2_9FLAO|nr:DUF423 domain-containing protein [Zobellia uliginosa]MDO6515772.1 DUF423 domain-containing protein [Zobellia uliginosa]SIS41022.1 Uncharacterized membrane protein YgdD, TMEM256/DUF423 family [Zobellia uliginosa]
MNKTIFLTGIVLGAMAVILGAFGAHGLEKLVDADAIQTFETGVRYQMYHALLLLVLGNIKALPEASKKLIFYFVLAGIFCFSFSIYLLAMNSLTDFDFRVIGLVTPLGGTLLIIGWGLFGYRVYKYLN